MRHKCHSGLLLSNLSIEAVCYTVKINYGEALCLLAPPLPLWQTRSMNTQNYSPATKRQRLSPEQRRTQLLSAAITAYAEQGVERAGHGDIAKLTRASTATVFNYFPTREALTDAVLKHVSQSIFNTVTLSDDKTGLGAVDILSELLSGFNALIDNDPDIVKVMLNWSVSFGPSVRPQYMIFQDRVLSELHKDLGKARTGQAGERAEARLIYAAAISYATMKLDKSPDAVINEYVKRVLGIFK